MSNLLKHTAQRTMNATASAAGSSAGSSALASADNRIFAKRVLACATILLATFALAFAATFAQPARAYAAVNQDGNPFTVNNVDDMIDLIKLSRGMNGSYQSFEGKKIVLTADIDFAGNEGKIDEIIRDLGSLTFGDAKHAFKGEFDGGGHYIRNLNYKRNLWKPAANTGLFSITQDAYLHDVHFANCYIGADFRGGVLVGQANATRIESVRMEDCTLSVTPANNAVSLITNAGVMGGMIAGEMKQSSMYDCTVQGGRVVNNSVVAVSGLGGEGLYLGAMVGSAENSVIEYSRVLPTSAYYAERAEGEDIDPYAAVNGKYPYLTEVYNRYEVAVGAVAGQGIYAGGVLGYANDVDVVDCFSTAWTHTWVANYVGVGSGNIGYVGGIIAHAKSKDEGANASQVIRCHFASNMESYQWNSLAIIPIIQSNKYLAGLVERDWEEDSGLYNSYFLRPLVVGMEDKIAWPDGYVRSYGDWLGLDYDGGKSVAGYAYGPIVDYDKYKDRNFWEGEGYDFAGNIDRQQTQATEDPQFVYGSTHVNKWVIDEKLGIPVHGSSVKATLDFPGASSVSISPSTIDSNVQTTADPYDFAVQGLSATETDLTFSTKMNVKGESFEGGNAYTEHAFDFVTDDTNNGGFRFQGWYRAHDIATNDLMRGSHRFFDPLVPEGIDAERSQQVYNNEAEKLKTEYAAHNSGTGDDRVTEFTDNDLFIAYYQAQVLFHDVAGNVIDKATSTTEAAPGTDDDWYNHQDKLPQVAEPAERGTAVSEKAKFLGWTTEKNNDTGGGWPDITNSQLADLKNAGKFFVGGEAVEKPMDLYPVYADLGSNIHVIVEGHELDGADDVNVRDGVAKVKISGSQGDYTLTLQGWNGSDWVDANNEHRDATEVLPDGYRFLGWYKVNLDSNGNPSTVGGSTNVCLGLGSDGKLVTADAVKYELGLRVSAEPVYQIPESDLGQSCYYYARFEYRVDYMVDSYLQAGFPAGLQKYSLTWETYLDAFEDIPGPSFGKEHVDHWSLNWKDNPSSNNNPCDGGDNAASVPPKTGTLANGIACHQKVYGHNSSDGGLFDIAIVYDFPNSAVISYSGDPGKILEANGLKIDAAPNPGFEFIRWNWQQDSSQGVQKESDRDKHPWFVGSRHFEAPNRYVYEANMVAHVEFIDAGLDASSITVNRAYSDTDNDPGFINGFQHVLLDESSDYEFKYNKFAGNKSWSDKPSSIKAHIAASPSRAEMQAKRPNSYFVGWIDKSAISTGTMTQAEYEAVYDEETRTATSLDAVLPYIVPDDALCERPMTLYPVYADYAIQATTNITRDTALADPADPTFDVDGIQMGENGVKSVVFTADVDEETAKTYKLVSWTVESPEGAVIDTVTEANGKPVSNENATLTYDIRPGTPYVIVANYEVVTSAALTVTYHVDHAGDAGPGTVVYEKTYGDILGKGPQPQFADDALANAIFVGWTETAPADGADFHVDTDGISLVDPGMYVERSMELWPVYKNVNIVVNSNIDDVRDPDDHRGWSMVTVNTSPVLDEAGKPVMGADGKPVYNTKNIAQLWAKPVDGYVFQGWYTGYADDNNLGTLLSTAPDYPLTDEAATSGQTFTAVYLTHADAKEYVVRYHYPDGTVVEEPIKSDSDDAFVGEIDVTKPVLDANGQPVLNADGTPKMETVTVDDAMLHGGEPTTALMQQFEQSSKDPAATYYEQFAEWQWAKTGNAAGMVAWDNFSTAKIVESIESQGGGAYAMDLYPKTYRFSSQEWKVDEQNPAGGTFEPYAPSNLAWYIDAAATGDGQAVKVAFKPGVLYLSNRLAIQMDEVVYAAPAPDAAAPALAETVTGVNDKRVGLYADFTDVSDANATPLDVENTGDDAKNFADGQAIFEFQNDGSLTIVKTAPAEAENSTFSFTVTQCDADGTVAPDAKSATAYVTVNKDGDISKGTVTINLPWGYYRVVESEWGWQYDSSMKLFMDGFTNENLPEGVILVKSMSNEAQVTNAHNGETYQDGEARTKNEFGQPEDVAATKTLRRAAIPNPTAEGGN